MAIDYSGMRITRTPSSYKTTSTGSPWMRGSAYAVPETQKTTYQDPSGVGGEFTQQGNLWRSGTGELVGDLGGYIGMKKQQAAGADFMPYQNKLAELLQDPSKVQQTAGYKFALDQGNQEINRSAAAKGMLGSGNVLAALAKYGQDMASKQYDTEANRLAELMRGSQQFGLSSGYYAPPKLSAPTGIKGVYRNNASPSYW